MSSSEVAESKKKPEPRLSVDIGGTQRSLFMSFGLLNEVAGLVGGVENVPDLSFNPAVSNELLFLLLVPRDKRGAPIPITDDAEPVVPLDLDPEVAEQIIDWAAGHVLDFFVRRFAKSAQMFATRAGDLAAVGSSLTSSTSSAGKTA